MKNQNIKNTALFNIFHPLYICYHLPLLENDSHPHHKHTETTIYIIFSVSKLHMKNIIYTATSNLFIKDSHCYTCYTNIQKKSLQLNFLPFHIFHPLSVVPQLSFTVTSHQKQKHTEANIYIFFPVPNLHMKNTF